mmetsp:Transcript_3776/g.5787  ORF Transcript_3776/g.5787 Transcript_3776/m.5787 type:complete len:344 (-) Transcript_3776:54-1085(-)
MNNMPSSCFWKRPTVSFLATILVHHSAANETAKATPSKPTADDVKTATATATGHNKSIHNESSATVNIRSYYANTNFSNKDSAYAKFREDDEQTFLDLFGERTKELLTQHIIPSTDIHCNWDWSMGRCEPYCECQFLPLWGDYNLGRSCRYRTSPPPQLGADGQEKEVDETSWQEAWQEVWQSQLTSGGDSATFVPPLFPKNNVASKGDPEGGRMDSYTCSLPPESRYIQIIQQFTQALSHSTVVIDHFQKFKEVSSIALGKAMVQGQHQFMNARHSACETVKRKIQERAQERDQPVVLTKQGAAWIRRVCGNEITGSGLKKEASSGEAEGDIDEEEENDVID